MVEFGPAERDATRAARDRSGPLYLRDAGAGPAVLLLHAFPLNGRMWVPQIEALSGRARLIAPDLPGFGLSPVPSVSPSLDDYAREIVAALDRLGIDQVVVGGLSMGGYLAFRLVGRLGERLRGLLLADTRPTPDTREAAVERQELAAEVEARGVGVAADEFLPKIIGTTTQRTRPELLDRVRAIIGENTPAGVAGALRAMAARPDSTPLLTTLRCPVLCVVGEEDRLTPPELAEQMVARVPRGRLEVIPESGHLSNLEAPESFNEALSTLIDASVAGAW